MQIFDPVGILIAAAGETIEQSDYILRMTLPALSLR